MLYPAASAVISGAAMYALGLSQTQSSSPQTKTAPAPTSTAAPLEKAQHAANTFTDDAITPIIRKIKMNEYCNITYSTVLLSFYEAS